MNKILSLLAALTLLGLAGCASPTGGPSIPVTISISGGATHARGDFVTFTAHPEYSGTGTLTYTWKINSFQTSDHGTTCILQSNVSGSDTIYVVVTDGKLSGSASTTVTFN